MSEQNGAAEAAPVTKVVPVVETAAVSSLLDALAGPQMTRGLRVHRINADGTRGPMLFSASDGESPESVRARIERAGPGDYELAPVVDGRYEGKPRRMTVEPPRAEPVASVAQHAAPADLHSIGGMIAGVMREAMSTMQTQTMQLQMEAQKHSLELMRDLLRTQRGSGGGDGGGGSLNDALTALMVAKLSEDPIERMLKLKKLTEAFKEDEAPKGEDSSVWSSLAGALAGIVAQSRQPSPAPAVLPIARVTASGAAAVAPASPAPAAASAAGGEGLELAASMLGRMAQRGADAAAVYDTFANVLDDGELQQAVGALLSDGAVDLLCSAMPVLAPHRAWLSSVVAGLHDLVADEAQPAGPAAAAA